MVPSDFQSFEKTLSDRLQKLMFLRVVFVSILLGASIFIQFKASETFFNIIQTSHYVLIGAVYLFTVLYIFFLKRLKNLRRFTYFQLLMDTFFVSALIFTTGGINSILSFLYIVVIINGSLFLYRKGGLIVASLSAVLYGAIVDLHYYGLIQPLGGQTSFYGPNTFQAAYTFYIILVNTVAFYTVALLSSYLSEQARKSRVELSEKERDIINLEASNEWIISSINSGLITINDNDKIVLINPAAEGIFQINADANIGQSIVDVIPPIAPYLKNHNESEGKRSRSLSFIDFPYERSSENTIFLRMSLSPLLLPGGEEGGQILVFQDMTKFKEIEKELKRTEGLALVGELAAGIAHEIRNPMASISGSIQMLKEDMAKNEVSQRLMEIILREISRLNHLVNDFLLFARPKELSVKHFDLNQVVNDSLELFKNSGNWTDRVKIETDLSDSIFIESDPQQLNQILWNLYLNAIEAMPQGGKLQIKTDLSKQDVNSITTNNSLAQISIRDTGGGFSDKALDHLFTPFFTSKSGGTGLGLATVKRIVDSLKGKVIGENHPEGGAIVTIRLNPSLSAQA